MERTAGVMAVCVMAACSGTEPKTAVWTQEAGYRWRDLTVPASGEPGFTRMDKAGIRFQNSVSDSALLRNRVLGQGAGVALGDVDGDGRVDVFLARTEGCSALYRNQGDWRFEEITRSASARATDTRPELRSPTSMATAISISCSRRPVALTRSS